jgi:hypothetical protein
MYPRLLVDEPEREEKAVSQLERGTWVELIDQDGENFGEAEVLHVEPYADGALSMLMYRMPGSAPDVFRFPADMTVPLLTEVEMAAHREAAKRAEKIADIKAYIAWLEANPSEPVGYGMGGQVDVPGDPAEAVARVRAFAAKHGGEVRELEDRTSAYVRFGSVDHRVIAWHRDGRPAGPAPVPADPTGLTYSREADDPTPVSPARVPLHTGGMTDGGLVDETDGGHVEACAGTDDDTRWAECACGVKVEGFDSLAEARQELERHIADATGVPCYAPNGYQAPEVIAERTAACAASHPDRPCTTPSAAEMGERADEAIREVYGEPVDEADDTCFCGHPECGAC